MLRKIKLYGELAEYVGHKEFEVKCDTLPLAVSFLINNFEGIEKYMSPNLYQVKVGNYDIDETEIHNPIGSQDIHFVPVISGAGRGLGKVLLGAALIAGAFLTGGASFSLKAGLTGTFLGKAAVGIGAALVLGGVSEMLFPLPTQKDFDNASDPRLSFSFSGLQNTSRAGTPVPLVYGEIFTGSVIISAAVDTQQVQA